MKIYIEKILTGCFILALGLVMQSLTFTQIQDASLAGVSPRAIPSLVARSIMVLSFIMIGQGVFHFFLEKRKGISRDSAVLFQIFPFKLFILILLYALVMNYAGYCIASFTILPLMMYVLKVRELKNYGILAGLIIFIFIVIDILLKIRLPKIGLFGII